MSPYTKRLVGLALAATSVPVALPMGASAATHPINRSVALRAADQVVSEINLLRARANLPAGQLTSTFTPDVAAAARADQDPNLGALGPVGASRYVAYGLWGIGPQPSTPLNVVKDWVFDDGWRGSQTINLDCTSPAATGCNGHRRAVLSHPPFAGAKLRIDVAVTSSTWDGASGVSVAALLIWS
jgi:hypothetical protein